MTPLDHSSAIVGEALRAQRAADAREAPDFASVLYRRSKATPLRVRWPVLAAAAGVLIGAVTTYRAVRPAPLEMSGDA